MPIFRFNLNGEDVAVNVPGDSTLLYVLRERLGLTAAKEGCGQGECGACTVLLDGKSVNSCLTLMPRVEGKRVTTLEGLAQNGELDRLQQAFIDQGAVQCGYCTPGMIMAAKAILLENPSPSEAEIRRGIAGNLCRCTGYTKIVAAVRAAAGSKEEG